MVRVNILILYNFDNFEQSYEILLRLRGVVVLDREEFEMIELRFEMDIHETGLYR